MKERQRENWIDLVKCIAIIIVVMNHAQWIVPGVNFLGGMFFVPVFFVLSGYTWKDKGVSFKQVVKNRAKRLLFPYATANLFLCTFFALKNGDLLAGNFSSYAKSLLGALYARNQLYQDQNALRFTLLSPPSSNTTLFLKSLNSPTWFLPALFLTLVLFEALYRLQKGKRKEILLVISICCLIAVLYHYISPVLLPWSLDAIPFFMLFFYVGWIFKEKNLLDYLNKKPIWIVIGLFVFGISAFVNRSSNYSIGMYGYSVTLSLINALVSSLFIMWICRWITKPFPKLRFIMGRHTLTILCYHLFVLAIIESLLAQLLPALKLVLTLFLLTVFSVAYDYIKGWIFKKNNL